MDSGAGVQSGSADKPYDCISDIVESVFRTGASRRRILAKSRRVHEEHSPGELLPFNWKPVRF